jgi:hypothetical protein
VFKVPSLFWIILIWRVWLVDLSVKAESDAGNPPPSFRSFFSSEWSREDNDFPTPVFPFLRHGNPPPPAGDTGPRSFLGFVENGVLASFMDGKAYVVLFRLKRRVAIPIFHRNGRGRKAIIPPPSFRSFVTEIHHCQRGIRVHVRFWVLLRTGF